MIGLGLAFNLPKFYLYKATSDLSKFGL